jgi:protein-disulfide isomerase
MRFLIALFAALLLGAAAPAAKAPDWQHTVVRTPDGAYQIGNPRARVQLVEYLSLTCPHCALMEAESHDRLGQMIANGSVRVELRHAVRDPLDLTATLIARCTGPAKLRDTMHLLFGLQPQWAEAGQNYEEGNPAPALPALADASGLSQIATGFGLSRPRIAACLASKPEQLALAHMAAAGWKLMEAHSTPAKPVGTPSFEINGRFAGSIGWDALLTQLQQAGAH